MTFKISSVLLCYFLCGEIAPMLVNAQAHDSWHIYQTGALSPGEKNIFVDEASIKGASYRMNADSILAASEYDRLLFVLNGSSTASTGSEKISLQKGGAVFLKAHGSLAISNALEVMLWTSKSPKTNHSIETKKFGREKIMSGRDPFENVWSMFIDAPTMVAGLYMLPESLAGDDTLLHEMDEINYVVNGTAKFKMNDMVIDVKPGSIMWVKRGVGHNFYDLSADFDVFILFETINMNHDH